MGARRKQQLRQAAEERLARYGPRVTHPEGWNASDTNDRGPFYGVGNEMPWEQYDSGFEVAHDAGEDDDVTLLARGPPIQGTTAAIEAAYDTDRRLPRLFYDFHLQGFLKSEESVQPRTLAKPLLCNKLYRPTLQNEIRVFELAAGLPSEPLCGHLHHVDIQFDVEAFNDTGMACHLTNFGISFDKMRKMFYTAVSYCWGSEDASEDLEVGGHVVSVTPIVATILRRLRHPKHAVRLWIDQICIDQSDIEDKQAQIGLMGRIYSRAFNTLIWLGEGPEDDAFDLLRRLAYSLWGTTESTTTWVDVIRPMVDHRAKSMRALMRLYQSLWFQRTWVVQELALSEQPYAMFGSKTILWSNFSQTATYIKDFDLFTLYGAGLDDSVTASRGLQNMLQLDDVRLRAVRTMPSSSMLSFWLENTRYAEVTIPVDKIYGILALCGDIVPASYNVSAAYVFTTIAEIIFSNDGLGVILRNVDQETDGSHLPSWVPDWSLRRQTTMLSAYGRTYQRAGGERLEQCASVVKETRTLITQALVVGDLLSVSEVFENADLTTAEPQSSNKDLRRAISFTCKCFEQARQEIDFRTWCATLVAGRDESRMNVFQEEFIEVMSLLCDESTGCKPSLPGQTYSLRQQKGHFSLEHLRHRKPARTFSDLKRAVRNGMLHRRLAASTTGHIVLVPRYSKPGDRVVILPGSSVPFIVRERVDNKWVLIGECYFHSIMDGQYFEAHRGEIESISIV